VQAVAQCVGTSTALIPDAPSLQARDALLHALQQAPGNAIVNVNFATGTCFTNPTCQSSVDTVAGLLKRGINWVEYGSYPFAFCAGTSVFRAGGISQLMSATGVQPPTPPPGQTFLAVATGRVGQVGQTAGSIPLLGQLLGGTVPLSQTFDPYSFRRDAWTWAIEAHYPFPYGFPVAEDLSRRTDFRVGPGPVGHTTVPGPNGRPVDVFIYPSFAMHASHGWYFYAYSAIDPLTYANFIISVLSPQLSQSSTVTSRPTVAGARPTLQIGSRGTPVVQLQQLLNQYGANIAQDGIFGPQTQAAVRAFQQANGLTVDGIVGPETWSALLSGHAKPISHAAPAPTPPARPSPSRLATVPTTVQASVTSHPSPTGGFIASLESTVAQTLHVNESEARILLIATALGAGLLILAPPRR
jgi:hypothetical protein